MISSDDKKIILVEKIEILEKKLTNYKITGTEVDFIYKSSCSYSLLALNFLICTIMIFIVQKSYVGVD